MSKADHMMGYAANLVNAIEEFLPLYERHNDPVHPHRMDMIVDTLQRYGHAVTVLNSVARVIAEHPDRRIAGRIVGVIRMAVAAMPALAGYDLGDSVARLDGKAASAA